MNPYKFILELSQKQLVQYLLLFCVIWISLRFFIKEEIQLNFFLRLLIVFIIFYFLAQQKLEKQSVENLTKEKKINMLKYFSTDYQKPDQIIDKSNINDISDIENQINHKETDDRFHNEHQHLQIDFVEKHESVIDFYIKYIDLRKINFKQFNLSLVYFDKVLEIIDKLKVTNSIAKKQLIDQLKQEKNNCLNEMASISVNIKKSPLSCLYEGSKTSHTNHSFNQDPNVILLNNALIELEKMLSHYYRWGLSKFNNNDNINICSYPKEYFNFTISGNLKKTPNYSKYYTLYI